MTYMTAWSDALKWYFGEYNELNSKLSPEEIIFISEANFSIKDCLYLVDFEKKERNATNQWLTSLENLLEWKRKVKEIKLKLFPELDWWKKIAENTKWSYQESCQRILDTVDKKIDAVNNSPEIIWSILDELLWFISLVEEIRTDNPRTPFISWNNLTSDSASNSYFTELKGEEWIRKGIWEAIIKLIEYQELVLWDWEAYKNYQKAINLCYLYADKLLHAYNKWHEDFIFTSDRVDTENWDEITTITTISQDWKITVERKIISSMWEED